MLQDLLSRVQSQLSGTTPSTSLLIWPAHHGLGDEQALATPDEITRVVSQAISVTCLQPELDPREDLSDTRFSKPRNQVQNKIQRPPRRNRAEGSLPRPQARHDASAYLAGVLRLQIQFCEEIFI